MGHTSAKSDLTMVIYDFKDRMHVWMAADASIFEPGTVQRMADCMEHLVNSLLDSPARRLDDVMLLTPADRQLLSGFCAGELRPKYLSSPPVHDVVAAVAARQPERPALVFEGRTLSYAALDAGASRVAAALLAHGIEPGTVVGVMLERSLELLVAMLGVFRAGGRPATACGGSGGSAHLVASRPPARLPACLDLPPLACAGVYLPCDPSYPEDRLSIYLEDAAAAVALASSRNASAARFDCEVGPVPGKLRGVGWQALAGR